jgi:tRNA (adenine37-N6)-methyltransferase
MPICMEWIATVRSRFTKDGVRMSRCDIIAEIVVCEDLAAALTRIEEWSHLRWISSPGNLSMANS